MPRTTKKPRIKNKNASSTNPSPPCPLLSLPPELRNNIYHLVAEEVDEVSIIGCKVDDSSAARGQDESFSETLLWKAVAKHPLSQASRQLRQEFDPIHRYRAFTTRVGVYHLELGNYDVDRIPGFSRTLSRMPSLRAHLKSTEGLTLRFQLNKYVLDSLEKIEAKEPGTIHRSFRLLTSLQAPHDKKAVLRFGNSPGLSPAQKKIAIRKSEKKMARERLHRLEDTVEERYEASLRSNSSHSDEYWSDRNSIRSLSLAHTCGLIGYRQELGERRLNRALPAVIEEEVTGKAKEQDDEATADLEGELEAE